MQNSYNDQHVSPNWVEIYLAANHLEANILVGLLHAQGIQAGIKGLGLAGGIGELPADAVQTAIFAPKEYKERAQSHIANYEKAEKRDWKCSSCQEMNGSAFEMCWNCGQTETDKLNISD